MRQGSPSRRPRSRGNGKRHSLHKNQSFESNGPEVKVRGTAQQVLEKYLILARDASVSGDRIAAEGYFQYAEHYFRLANVDANVDAKPGARQESKPPTNGPNGQDKDKAAVPGPDNSGVPADHAQPSPTENKPASETSEDTAGESSQDPVQA